MVSPPLITVVSLNLRFGLAADGPNGWRFRKPAVAEFLNQFPLDFLCLQEVNDFQAKDIAGMLPEYQYIGLRWPAPEFWQNNLIYYHPRWRCEAKDHFFLSPTPDIPSRIKESKWPRQATLGRFCNGNRFFQLVTTHFDFDEAVQKQMASILIKRIGREPANEPIVITGDFNAVPGSAPFQALTISERGNSRSSHFKSVFDSPFPGTHHRYQGQSDGRHIDWILYRGGLNVKGRGIVTRRIRGMFLSDHFPAWATFTHDVAETSTKNNQDSTPGSVSRKSSSLG